MNYDTLLVGSIPLMVVVFGLVEMIKSLGLRGGALTVLSMLLGSAFGLAYKLAQAGFPGDFAGWFGAVVFGLLIGLAASGFYKFAAERFPRTDDGSGKVA
jgi:amino acid transporter